MSRTTMLAAAALTIGLATSATPAMASTAAPATASRAQISRDHDHDHWRHHRHHHWRGFVLGGAITNVDLANNEITIDPRRGPNRTLEVTRFTRITRDGDRAALKDLTVGDRAFVRGVTKHGDRWAIRIDALS